MKTFDPRTALDALNTEYGARAHSIRADLARRHSADFEEQALQRQNDEVLQELLAEAEAGLRLVGLATLRLADGSYGNCLRCGEPIAESRLQVLPMAEHCVTCAALTD